MARNKKKRNIKKIVSLVFASSIVMPSLVSVASMAREFVEGIQKANAATINKDIGLAAYVKGANKEYFDYTNYAVYSLPVVPNNGNAMSVVKFCLTKANPKASTTIKYHIEAYTSAPGEDFEVPGTCEVIIPANKTSATVTINHLQKDTYRVLSAHKADFGISRAFKVVIDSVVDTNNVTYNMYDGSTEKGYKEINGILYKNSVLCTLDNKYNYFTTKIPSEDLKSSKVMAFDDYYDYMSQKWGGGEGDKKKNTYDRAGNDDKDEGRWMTYRGGGCAILPYKYHEYNHGSSSGEKHDWQISEYFAGESDNQTEYFKIYKNWRERILETNLGSTFGSVNLRHLGGSRDDDANKYMEFYLGDYTFGKDAEKKDLHGERVFYETEGLDKKHYAWVTQYRVNRDYGSHDWQVDLDDVALFQEWIANYPMKGDNSIPENSKYWHDIWGYGLANNDLYDKNEFMAANTKIDYGKKVNGSEYNAIPWFKLPQPENDEDFGFTVYQSHERIFKSNPDKRIYGNTYFSVLDDTTPYMVRDAYADASTVNKDGKIKVTLYYSEPMQSFEHSYFNGSIGTDAQGNKITLQFRPSPGQLPGCSAICYEADTKDYDDILCTELRIESNLLTDAVPDGEYAEEYTPRDFAQNGGNPVVKNEKTGHLYNKTFSININRKNPVLSMSSDNIGKNPQRYTSAKLQLEFFNEGKVYYTFVKDNGDGLAYTPTFTENEVDTNEVYSNCKEVSASGGTTVVNLDLPAKDGRSGDFYCYTKAVTSYGREKYYPVITTSKSVKDGGIGPFRVDNIAPVIKVTRAESDDRFNSMTRTFEIEVEEDCGIDKVSCDIHKTSGILAEQVNTIDNISLNKNGNGKYVGSVTLSLENMIQSWYTMKETGAELFNPPLDYEDFSISFRGADNAGNEADHFFYENEKIEGEITYPFSRTPCLAGNLTPDQNPIVSEIEGLNLYQCGTKFTFTSKYKEAGLLSASVLKLPAKDQVRVFNDNLVDTISGIKITQNPDVGSDKYSITEIELTKPGYYEIVVKSSEGTTSESHKVYISDNLTEDTPNYLNSRSDFSIPKMMGYKLNEEAKQYYLDGAGSYHEDFYGGTSEPIFSTAAAAREYIKVHEYEDMHLIQLNKNAATQLNEVGGTSLIKASTESMQATEGQYWIRYKNSNWTIGSRSSTSWAYYFYSSPVGGAKNVQITKEQIANCKPLNTQINEVANLLSSKGETVYLADDAYIDQKTGAPKLSEKQVAISQGCIVTETKSGDPVANISCPPDTMMYSNDVSIMQGGGKKTYKLCTNLPLVIKDTTTLYFAKSDGLTPVYKKISAKNGTTIREAFNVDGEVMSGIYKILEIDENGANLFEVYIDKDTPELSISRSVYSEEDDATITTTNVIDSQFISTMYSRMFQINGLPYGFNEIDDEAYVAVYQKGVLKQFRYLKNMTTPLNLEDGIYDVTVSDRSGNSFSFRTFVSASDINVTFKSNGDNSKATMSITNRESNELIKFEVYCDGELLSNDLDVTKTFTSSGSYYAIIQDQYGNKLTTPVYTFTKTMPSVKISYSDGQSYFEFKENDDKNTHVIKTVSDEAIVLSTDTLLRFEYDKDEADIEVLGTRDDFYIKREEYGSLTMLLPVSFSFRVFYKDAPDEAQTYTVVFDNQEPLISGEYQSPSYIMEESNEAFVDYEQQAPTTLDYRTVVDDITGQIKVDTCQISNGSTFTTEYLHFTVSDNTKVKQVVVTRNGEEVAPTFVEQGFEGLEFYLEALPGNYTIVAYDIFGKPTSMSFAVTGDTFTSAKLDGENVSPLGPINNEYGSEEHKVLYGHDSFTIDVPNNTTTNFLYTDSEGKRVSFTIIVDSEGMQYGVFHAVKIHDTEIDPISGEEYDVETLEYEEDYNKQPVTEDVFSPIDGVNLTITKNKDGSFTVNFVSGEDGEQLDIRTRRDESAFNLYNLEFSKEQPEAVVKDGNTEITPVNGYAYASKEANLIGDFDDVEIQYAYNAISDDFSNAEYSVYDPNISHTYEQGFYHFILTNKYGNVTEYTVVLNDTITGSVTENFIDKDSETYSVTSQDYFYSNNTVVVTGYNCVSLTEKNGSGYVSGDTDKMQLILNEAGTYEVTMKDLNNNTRTIYVVIGSQPVEFKDEWISNTPSDPTLYNQDYANHPMTIDLDQAKLDSEEISQVYYVYNGEKYIIYGYVDENTILAYDENNFINVIGSQGEGTYTVYVANKYGDICYRDLFYRVTETIVINKTSNDVEGKQTVTLADAEANGVWANINVQLSSELDASQYILYIKSGDGTYQQVPINYLFELTNASSGGEVHYTVKYVDIYGNCEEFTINLLRRTLAFSETGVNNFEYDSTNYTKNNFTFDYDPNDVTVIYYFNGQPTDYAYAPNEVLFKDGVYEFHMFDKAGNQAVYVVTKDSYVVFDLRVEGQPGSIIDGGAVNANRVTLVSDSDEGVEIVSVKLNGEFVNIEGNVFTKSGHYEFITKDKLGNVRYSHFYLIGNELASFDYYAPTDFDIVSVSFINKQGIKTTYTEHVDKTNNHLDLTNAPEGTYEIQIKNRYDNSVSSFTVVIDKKVPKATLAGCSNGDVTTKTINLDNLETGDIVTVYKDGEVVQRVEVGASRTIDDITEGGDYRIVVENKAGTSVEYTFQKLKIANGALSALIMIGLMGVAAGFFAVLVLRNRSKTDE